MKRVHGVVRQMMAAVLLPIMLLPLGAGVVQSGGKDAVSAQHELSEVKLLLDGDYFTALLSGINRAREEIFFSAYLFKTIETARGCPEAVLNGLIDAVGRGVRVEAIIERNRDADDLNRSNAETAKRLGQGGIRVCLDAPDRQTHTKLVVIDRRYVLIGSHNLTQSALKFNHEASVWIDSVPLAEEALRYMRSLCPEEKKTTGRRRR